VTGCTLWRDGRGRHPTPQWRSADVRGALLALLARKQTVCCGAYRYSVLRTRDAARTPAARAHAILPRHALRMRTI